MTPEKASQMIGYARVSRVAGRNTDDASYGTVDVQRKAIEEWANRRGIEITDVLVDEDQSGGTQQRPEWREVMRRIGDGETDGVAVYKLDRFARTVAGAYEDLKLIQEADAHIAFVADGDIDTTTPGGKALLGVLLVFAEWTLDTLKASWEVTKDRALERGAFIGPTPFGYRRVEDGEAKGTLVPDGEPLTEVVEDEEGNPMLADAQGLVTYSGKAGLVQHAFALAREPDGIGRASAYLEEHAPDHRWTTATVRRMLGKRVYRGEVIYGEYRMVPDERPGRIGKKLKVLRDIGDPARRVVENAHDALVAESVWTLAQVSPQRRKPKAKYPLTSVLHCESCGGGMAGGHLGSKPAKRGYRCTAWQRVKRGQGDPCDAPSTVLAEPLEAHVRAELEAKLAENGNGRALTEAVAEAKQAQAALQEAEDHVLALAGADAAMRRQLGGSTGWQRAMAQATSERDEALERAGRAQQAIYIRGSRKRSAAERLRTGKDEDFADVVNEKVAAITVARGRGNLDERVTVELFV